MGQVGSERAWCGVGQGVVRSGAGCEANGEWAWCGVGQGVGSYGVHAVVHPHGCRTVRRVGPHMGVERGGGQDVVQVCMCVCGTGGAGRGTDYVCTMSCEQYTRTSVLHMCTASNTYLLQICTAKSTYMYYMYKQQAHMYYMCALLPTALLCSALLQGDQPCRLGGAAPHGRGRVRRQALTPAAAAGGCPCRRACYSRAAAAGAGAPLPPWGHGYGPRNQPEIQPRDRRCGPTPARSS